MSASSHNRQLTASRGGTGKESTPANNVSNGVKTQEAIAGTVAEIAPSNPVQKNKIVTHLPQDIMGNRMKKELERKSNLDKKNYFWGMTGATLKKAAKVDGLEEGFNNVGELKAFAAWKIREGKEYDTALEKREEDKALVGSGKMIREEFIAKAAKEPREL